jgi:hypothetical protein
MHENRMTKGMLTNSPVALSTSATSLFNMDPYQVNRFIGTKAQCEAECNKEVDCKGFVRLSDYGAKQDLSGLGNANDIGVNWCLLTEEGKEKMTGRMTAWDAYFKNPT